VFIAILILTFGTAAVWLALAGLVAVGVGTLAVAIYITALVTVLIRKLISKGTS
jgi:hypothetical protein